MTETETLLAQLEQAPGPSKALNRAVAMLAGWHRVEPRHTRNKYGGWIAPENWIGRMSDGSPILDGLHGTTIHREPPDFTGSIDCALSLVGKDDFWRVGIWPSTGWEATVRLWSGRSPAPHGSPAHALCTAAVKALAAAKVPS